MTKLTLRLLGRPEALAGSEPLRFATRKELTLLAYLALEQRPHDREKLVGLLWPDSPSAAGRATLRGALAHLRTTLGDLAPALDAGREWIRLDPASVEVDALEVRRLAAGEGDEAALDAGVALAAGDLLEGIGATSPDFEAWIAIQRASFRRDVGRIFERLWRLKDERGDTAAATALAREWAARQLDNERAHRRLIQSLLAAGDAAGALEAFELCRELLRASLGVDPSPELLALARRAAALHARGHPSGPLAERPPELVGRDVELQRFRPLFDAALAGRPRLLLLTGEAGIGKSRLMDELERRASGLGLDVLSARATPGSPPYAPIAELLRRRLDRENAPDDLLSDVWLSELSRLVPEIRDRYPDLELPVDDAASPSRLVDAVVEAVAAFAAQAPVLIAIDDLHWADIATRDLLAVLIARLRERQARAAIAVALRSEAAALDAGLGEWRRRVLAAEHPDILNVGALGLPAVRALAESANDGGTVDGRLVEWLFRETGGHPFYLVETLRMLAGRLESNPAELQRLVPPGVRAVVVARIESLPPEARAILTSSAVLELPSAFDDLRLVAGLDEDSALTALDQSGEALLLTEAGPGRYRVSHDLVRDIVYTEAGEARRRVYHRRAYAGGSDRRPAVLARHTVAAGLPDAADACVAAAEEAMRLFGAADSVEWYRRAVDALGPGALFEKFARIRLGLARAIEVQGRPAEAAEVLRAIANEARDAGAISIRAVALNRLLSVTAQIEGPDKVIPLLEEVIEAATRAGDDSLIAEARWNQSQLFLYGRMLDESAVAGETALSHARQAGDEALLGKALSTLAMTYTMLGRFEEVEAYGREQLALAERLGDRAQAADAASHAANGPILLGRPREAEALASQGYRLATEVGSPWGRIAAAIPLTRALVELDRTDEALEIGRAAIDDGRACGVSFLHLLAAISVAVAERAAGNFDAALGYLGEALRVSGSDENLTKVFGEFVHAELAETQAVTGDLESAARHARAALAYRDYRFNVHTGLARHHEILALLAAGDADLATEDLRRFAEQVAGCERFHLPLLRARAALAAHTGDLPAARDHLEAALALARRLELPREIAGIEREMALND